MAADAEPSTFLLAGLDENGLGARLGPLLVTGTLARVTEDGERWLRRKLSRRLARDLDDSKNLLSFGNHQLGEAWARALAPSATSPSELLHEFSLRSEPELRRLCPHRAEPQCWRTRESFQADAKLVRRVTGHLRKWEERGVRIVSVRAEILCVRQLNNERSQGANRFVSDLHAMERLLLTFRELGGAPLRANCGKVGGIADYDRYFGPLSGTLRTTLQSSRALSAYQFADLGEVRFSQDADAHDPLVMLASMIGKYLREITMARIARFYVEQPDASDQIQLASGYHDPVTRRFVQLSRRSRKKLGIPDACFEREGP